MLGRCGGNWKAMGTAHERGASHLIIYGCGDHLYDMLQWHPELSAGVEHLLDSDEDKVGICPCAGLPAIEPKERLMAFPPGTEIVISAIRHIEAIRRSIAEMRPDLTCVSIDDAWQRIEQEHRKRERAQAQSQTKRRIFWGATALDIAQAVPLRDGECVIDENPAWQGGLCYGLPILSPQALCEVAMDAFVIVYARDYHRVRTLLQEQGLREYEDFASAAMIRSGAQRGNYGGLRRRWHTTQLVARGSSPKVSVIMPSLNVVKYIRQAVESVQHQTLRDIEILCVDAGSTDGTREILDELAKGDQRIHVLISDVRSYGHQVNMGLNAAHGEYIGIVETDDWVLPEMYEEQYAVAKAQHVDFLRADRYIFKGEGWTSAEHEYLYMINSPKNHKLYGRAFHPDSQSVSLYWGPNVTSGIFRRAFLEQHDIRLNESPGAAFQDNGLFLQTMIYAQSVLVMPRAYYMVRRDRAESSVFDRKNVHALRGEYAFMQPFVAACGKRAVVEFFYWSKCANNFWRLTHIEPAYQREFLDEMIKDFQQDIESGALPREFLGRGIFLRMQKVAADPEKYYRETVLPQMAFEQQLVPFNDVIVYGRSGAATSLIRSLSYGVNPKHILACATAERLSQTKTSLDVPVRCIDDLLPYRENTAVCVTGAGDRWLEIEQMLKKKGFQHVLKAN